MNKEQQELLGDAYENYKSAILEKEIKKSAFELTVQSMSGKTFILPQEEFINKCKTDPEFSEKWGLKIEEQIVLEQVEQNNPVLKGSTSLYSTKLITITYNDKTIEVYE